MGGLFTAGTFGLIAEYFLKTTAVLTLALLTAAASRRRPAAFRHFVLSFALIGLLLLPLLSLAPVGWRTTLLPARPASTGTTTPIPARPHGKTVEQAMGIAIQGPPAGSGQVPEPSLTSTAAEPFGASTWLPRLGEISRPPEFSSPPISESATSRLPGAGANPLNSLVTVLWAAGLIILFLRLAVGLAGAVKLTAQGTPLGDPAWRFLLERFKALVSLRRNIRLKGHPEVLVPMTWGWRKPVVLMPAGADAWTEEQRSSALFHELSHVKRADFLVMLLVRTSLAAFWFNPLCWVVYRALRKEQEIACDELVLHAGIRPSTYAASLLAFRRSAGFRWNPSAALLGMVGRSSFHERLAAILKQKLTFKEVKMKTKIMLASAVVLAVALVGTARPAVGVERADATATIVESALTVPASLDAAPLSLAAQEKQVEKVVAQEKKKEKATAEKKILVTAKEGRKTPIVITITEGDTVKTLTFAKPLTITTEKDGHGLVLTSEGKEIEVLKGEPLRLEIKGGAIELIEEGKLLKGEPLRLEIKEGKILKGEPLRLEIKEGKILKAGEDGVYTIVKKGDKAESSIVFYGTAKGETVEAAPEVFVKRLKDIKEGEKWIAAEKANEGSPEIAWTVKEPGKAFSFSSATDKEMLEKVHALQEQVAAIKAKKLDITALEESLKKLEAELKAKEEKLNKLEMTFEKAPAEITVIKKIGEGEAKGDVFVYEKIRGDKSEGAATVWVAKADEATAIAKIGISTDDNAIQIVLGGQGTGPEDFERAVAKLKKELPEGYKLLEQKFDAENGTMTFKIAPPEGAKVDEKLVRKLVDGLKAEIKTKK